MGQPKKEAALLKAASSKNYFMQLKYLKVDYYQVATSYISDLCISCNNMRKLFTVYSGRRIILRHPVVSKT